MRLARGAASAAARTIDPTRLESWEFTAFSQNGEDGAIDYLTRQLLQPNNYFLEIGASDGLENNSAWLAIGRRFSGVMIEGDEGQSRTSALIHAEYSLGVESRSLFITRDPPDLGLAHADPDVCSIDIDGNDLYVLEAVLGRCSPKILVVEYNATFGPERSVTIPYRADFDYGAAHPTKLYYGVSVTAWRRFVEPRGYRFVGVESHGVNAFFARQDAFEPAFLEAIRATPYRENFYQRHVHRAGHEELFGLIADQALVTI